MSEWGEQMRTELKMFVAAMETKLASRDDERYDRWKNESVAWLVKRLEDEMEELDEARENCDPIELARECVDVANFAMFIYWVLNKKGVSHE